MRKRSGTPADADQDQTALGIAVSGSLADYLGIEGLKPFIDNDLILAETSDFHIPGTQLRGRGILAERFLEKMEERREMRRVRDTPPSGLILR